MKYIRVIAALISCTALLPLGARAVVYVNETFEDDTVGNLVTDPAQKNVLQVTNIVGSGVIGTDNAARFNDNGALSGNLEYNVGGSALGSMYVQFDLFNNNPSGTGTGVNPIIFAVGPWSTTSPGIQLGANASRSFGVEFYQVGDTSTLRFRTNSSTVLTSTYSVAALQTVKIFVNDNDSATLDYLRPDTLVAATLGINSFVVWINDALVGSETVAGFAMNSGGVGSTVGNTTVGRVGFGSTTALTADFLLDNIIISDIPAVPEPTTTALVLGGGLLMLGLRSRRSIAGR